jgi:hypothetical protein
MKLDDFSFCSERRGVDFDLDGAGVDWVDFSKGNLEKPEKVTSSGSTLQSNHQHRIINANIAQFLTMLSRF